MVLENLVITVGKAKLADYIANPKGSRQFQQFIKLGTKEHRNSAIDALAKQVPDLAMRNIYALLTLEKIVTYGLKTDETLTVERILKPVMSDRKTVEKLLYHRLGCKFLNKLYLHPSIKPALKKQMTDIVLIPRSIELLGESREKLRQYYLETAKRCIDKELLGFDIIQKLFKQAVVDFADDKDFNAELLAMAADGLPHLLSSRDGVTVVVKMLGIASAKQKKAFIKELKGKFAEMAKNSVTCVVILRLLECVDDTVLLGKSVLSELIGSDYTTGKNLLLDTTGRIPFLFALEKLEMKTGRCYLQPDRQLLASSPTPSAMKEQATRTEEILTKLIPSVTKIVKSDMETFMQSDAGKDVVVALIKSLSESEDQATLVSEVMANMPLEITQPVVTCISAILKEVPESAETCWAVLVDRIQSGDMQSAALSDLCQGLGSFILMNLIRSCVSTVASSVRGALQQVSLKDGNKGTEILAKEVLEGACMAWSETVKHFAEKKPVTKKRSATESESCAAKKKPRATSVTEEGEGKAADLFGDDEEMWGLVGDDDEFLDE